MVVVVIMSFLFFLWFVVIVFSFMDYELLEVVKLLGVSELVVLLSIGFFLGMSGLIIGLVFVLGCVFGEFGVMIMVVGNIYGVI